jgi:hypothetical protein
MSLRIHISKGKQVVLCAGTPLTLDASPLQTDSHNARAPKFLCAGYAALNEARLSGSIATIHLKYTDACALTSASAAQAMKDTSWNASQSYLAELTGVLFIEFLRAHFNRAALTRIGHLIGVATAMNANSFDSTFRYEIGVSFSSATSAFLELLENTQQSPAERLRRTLFMPRAFALS